MQSYNRAFGHNRHQCTVQELTEIQTWFRCNLLMRRSLQSALFLAAIGAIAPQISGREHSIVRIFDDWAKGGRSSTSPLKSHTWLVRGKYSMCACVEFSLENHDFMRNFVLRVVNVCFLEITMTSPLRSIFITRRKRDMALSDTAATIFFFRPCS